MKRTASFTRRAWLKGALLGTAGLATTLWLPRRGRAMSPVGGSIKRLILVHAPGGVRWTASFDGQADVKRNPWGLMPWELVASGAPPAWGFSRALLQRPLWQDATDWSGHLYPYLSSDDPAHFNLARPRLPTWQGAMLPNLADLAARVAVVRVTANPDGPFDDDHATAAHTLYTGYRAGQAGLVTVLQDALRRQLGDDAFDRAYPLLSVTVSQPGWAVGVGDLAASRPIFLKDAASLPTAGQGSQAGAWGRGAESAFDARFAATRPARDRQRIVDFANDKTTADRYVPQLLLPALKLSSTDGSAALGTLLDGSTAVSNDMLAEAFGLSSDQAQGDDLFRDVFAALQASAQPSWTAAGNPFGLNGALAVRLLQVGAPVVSITVGRFDTHSYEVIDPYQQNAMPTQVTALGRLFAGLAFALQAIADPTAPGASLWDSTVVMACSEFGRGGPTVGDNGFNSPNGSNDGGSEHDPWAAWPIFGGPVTAGGQLLSDAAGGGFYQQNRIFTTLLRGFGVTDSNNSYLPYDQFPPIAGLVSGV